MVLVCVDSTTLLGAFAAHAEASSSIRFLSESDGSHSDRPIPSRPRRDGRRRFEQFLCLEVMVVSSFRR